MKVLLTGAFGNIGANTVEHLLKQGHKVRCFDLETKANKKTAVRFEDRIETVWGDVRRPDDLATAVQDRDVVIHLAFITDLLRSWKDPDWACEVNVGGTKNLLEAMKNYSEPCRIIFASSISVFGQTQHLQPPRSHLDPVNPTIVYAHHKVECEELIKKSGLDWSILRFAFAPPVLSRRFDPIVFYIELDSRMEFVHPNDVGLAVANAVSSAEVWGRILLIGGGPGCQIYYRDFIRQIMKAAGIGVLPDKAFASLPSSPVDWVDSTESQKILTYQRHSFEDFVREMRAALGPARYFVPLFAPFIRRWMLRQSPYFRA